jgi:16S rRNA (uracil1498-N3)-methyltransferase
MGGVGHLHHRRFFVSPACINAERVAFLPEQARQMARVLRLRVGDAVLVFDGSGRELRAALTEVSSARASARVVQELPPQTGSSLRITLGQLVPRGPAMDWILAKATELGVARIVACEGGRSVRRPGGGPDRWRRIIQEAAEQCGRRELPELAPVSTLEGFLRGREMAPLLVCAAEADSRPLPEVCRRLRGASELALLVGGEGGFTEAELAQLRAAGAILASLGPRLLRTDTAAVAALAVVQALVGDWGRSAGDARGTGAGDPTDTRVDTEEGR